MKKLLRILFLPIRVLALLVFIIYVLVKKLLSPKVIWPITAVIFFCGYYFETKLHEHYEMLSMSIMLISLFLSVSYISSRIEHKLSQLGGIPCLFAFIFIGAISFWTAYVINPEYDVYFLSLIALFFLGIWGFLYTIVRFFKRPKPLLFLSPSKWPSVCRPWFIFIKAISTKYMPRTIIIIQCIIIVLLWFRVGKLEKHVGIRSWICNEQNSIDAAKKAIVRIATKDGEGTGFFIHPEGVILTNTHVVGDDIAPKIIFSDYSFTTARIFARYTKEDIAVLQIDKKDVPYLSLSKDDIIKPQEELFIVGYPLGTSMRGDATVVRKQYITSRTFKDNPVTYLQTELGLDEGISGSPVVNACGIVVGMATMSTDATSMAISSKSILETVQPADPRAVIGQLSEEKRELKDSFDLPSDAVLAYYDAIRARRFHLAYDLLSYQRIKNVPFEEWIKGYANTMDATVVDFQDIKEKPGTVLVRLRAIDLVGQDMVMTYYEGEWTVIKEDNAWKLNESNIKKMEQPPWWAWW